jgi:hypothetical protein
MFKVILWEKPKPYKELMNVKLPMSFSFVLDYKDGELHALGITSTFLSIEWNEIKMINEGFS